jgi:hypothetical protein
LIHIFKLESELYSRVDFLPLKSKIGVVMKALLKHTLLSLLMLAGVSLTSCQCQKEKQEDQPEESTSISPSTEILRLTPEQVSNQIQSALEFEYGWRDQNDEFYDVITNQFAVPLGGIDFITAAKRDDATKVQTLLIVRRIAWDVASGVVWREANPDTNEVILFTACDLTVDRPILPHEESLPESDREALLTMEERWRAQLELFYWRLFSRPPSEEELSLIRATAIDIMLKEGWPPTMWTMILYSLLSTQEFWTI